MISKFRESLVKFFNIWRILFRSLPLLWSASPLESTILGIIIFVQGLVPALSIWLTKQVVDTVADIAQGGEISIPIIWLIVMWGGTLFIEAAIDPWVFMLVGNLNEELTAHVNLLLMQKACSLPDLHAFENVAFYNDLKVLQKQAASRPVNLIIILVGMGRQLATLGAMIFLLGTLEWWFSLLILIFAVPQIQVALQLQRSTWQALLNRSPESRKMDYFSMLTMTDTYAKEVRLFNVGSYFINQFRVAFVSLHHTMRQIRAKKAFWAFPIITLSISGNLFVFWWVVTQALKGNISPGDVVLFIQALAQTQRNLIDFSENFSFLYERVLFFDKLFEFLEYESPMQIKIPALQVFYPLQTSITFREVIFYYPDGHLALDNVSFEIRAGEKIALVGENGAGKSTIVKLLARFYDPTEGVILVDGVDLRDLDLAMWRQQIGAVFQDFGKYSLTIQENINLGNMAIANDLEIARLAAEQAGFSETVERLPKKYQTFLGKQFDGIELSGGQWQKLALARAFARHASLLILDEPTASLDPRSEYELFLRFARLTDGKTTLMVTHRLASIRMVDRILVLKGGKLVETGTHTEMLKCEGEYASLYHMQASLYNNTGLSQILGYKTSEGFKISEVS